MNSVLLIGRLTKDPEMRSTTSGLTTARLSVAINRGKDKDGKDMGADYPNVVVFGRTAENCEKFLKKGRLVGVEGRIQTGSYEKDGKKYYTTDVIASRIEFLEWGDKDSSKNSGEQISGFEQITDEDIPF